MSPESCARSQFPLCYRFVARSLGRQVTAKQRDARDEATRVRNTRRTHDRARVASGGALHVSYTRNRQVSAERMALRLEPERLQPADDFFLDTSERLAPFGKTDPDHSRWTRRGKDTASTQAHREPQLVERPRKGVNEGRRSRILHLSDEHEREMKIVGPDPARIETGPAQLLFQIVRGARCGGADGVVELRGDEKAHQPIMRLTRSSAAWVD